MSDTLDMFGGKPAGKPEEIQPEKDKSGEGLSSGSGGAAGGGALDSGAAGVDASANLPSPPSAPERPTSVNVSTLHTVEGKTDPVPKPVSNAGPTTKSLALPQGVLFGERRLVGQERAREQISRLLSSGRLGHAYLFTGPKGSGKTAFALAFAEAINGIDHITPLGESSRSRKSNWFSHPDIHVFFPLPSTVSDSDRANRIALLSQDPYEVIDYVSRPSIHFSASGGKGSGSKAGSAGNVGSASSAAGSGSSSAASSGSGGSKNLRAFYSIQYYREEIRQVTKLKPNEGARTVVVLIGIDTMRAETANAFLKQLEEPGDDIVFILTSDRTEGLLPTIVSRCQTIRLQPLRNDEVTSALVQHDGHSAEDAALLARISDGNYPMARSLDLERLRDNQDSLVQFLRLSYSQDATGLVNLITRWNTELNTENQMALLSSLEMFIRDLVVFREQESETGIIHIDQMKVIRDFAGALGQARLESMLEHTSQMKRLLLQNVQFKLICTVLSLRFTSLLRGQEPVIPSHSPWLHLPSYQEAF